MVKSADDYYASDEFTSVSYSATTNKVYTVNVYGYETNDVDNNYTLFIK